MQNNIFSGLFVGQNFVTIKEVDSTNNYLKNLVANSTPVMEGTVIMAENQFAGRGQQQNGWHAEPGKNLTFSLLLNPVFLPLGRQFDLTCAISLGVYHALYPLLGNDLKIKWPNDIYYKDQKLGGMLIENMVQGSIIKNAVAGIGLNINQEHFPPHLPNPTSVKQILHQDYDLKVLLSEICRHIEAWYLQLKGGNTLSLRQNYKDHLYWLGQARQFKADGRIFTGTIKDVKENGLLSITDESGNEFLYNLKEIEFLNKTHTA